MKPVPGLALFTCGMLLSSCSSTSAWRSSATAAAPISTTRAAPANNASAAGSELTRVDQQGAVGIEVTPLNLRTPGDSLEFDVWMNTHSVDLSMDLAALATLTTDTGVTVQATLWDAARGGHHVAGRLVFPATTAGRSVLDGASKLTLTIVNVDAAARIYEWVLK
jgi:hypothetical protein